MESMRPDPYPTPEPDSQSVSQEAGRSSLPFEKQHHVDKLMAAIGDHADIGTQFVVRALAKRLPEAALVKVTESVQNSGAVNRAGYAVSALQSEFAELTFRRSTKEVPA